MHVCDFNTSRNCPLSPEADTSYAAILIINTQSHYMDPLSTKNAKQDFEKVLKENEDLQNKAVPPFKVAHIGNLRPSSDQCQEDWVSLAHIIKDNYDKYRGFVVNYDTDNMVPTATALSFMLENLGKPVVFTGSAIPAYSIHTDLKSNIIAALFFANCAHLAEVCIFFDEHLFRANRTVKKYRSSSRLFVSPHFPPLARMHGSIRLERPLIQPFPRCRFRVMDRMENVVLTLKLGPSLRPHLLYRAIALTDARGLVIIAYGDGNGPTRGDFMKEMIKRAVRRNMVVVVCTQNLHGLVDLGSYAAGKQLKDAGAISSHDMTIDTAIMKLKYLLGTGASIEEIKKKFSENLRGEISSSFSKL